MIFFLFVFTGLIISLNILILHLHRITKKKIIKTHNLKYDYYRFFSLLPLVTLYIFFILHRRILILSVDQI